jgi:hypothetical protein
MIEKTILAATSASVNNPAALAALALISLSIAEPFHSRSQSELFELIGKWTRTLEGVDPAIVDAIATQLRATQSSIDALVRPFKQAI